VGGRKERRINIRLLEIERTVIEGVGFGMPVDEIVKKQKEGRKKAKEVPSGLIDDVKALEARLFSDMGSLAGEETRTTRQAGNAERGLAGLFNSGWSEGDVVAHLYRNLVKPGVRGEEVVAAKKKIEEWLEDFNN